MVRHRGTGRQENEKMNHIIELAERLGKAIADCPQAAGLRAAREELNNHQDLKKLFEDYQQQALKIATLEREQKTIEVEDKHLLQQLEDKLLASEVFKKFTAAQVEYVDVMRKVNEALQKPLAGTEKD